MVLSNLLDMQHNKNEKIYQNILYFWYQIKARWSSGIALRSTMPLVQGSNTKIGKVHSVFHLFSRSIK